MEYAILGATVAGIQAAKTIRQQDPKAKIYVVSFEVNPFGYYDRELMPQHLLRGASNPDDGLIEDAKTLKAQGIELDYNLMEAVFPRSNQLLLNHGIRRQYDQLLLAMESTPKIHEAPGASWLGVHQLRIYEDITWIENWMDTLKEAGVVIISHGIHNLDNDGKLGLEMCYVLKQRGVDVTYVTSQAYVGAPFLDAAAGERIERKLAANGIQVITNQTVTAYLSEDQAVLDAVELSDGRTIAARMALSTVGTVPTIDVVEDNGLEIDEDSDAIIVNEKMQTNIPNIFAAGSVASLNGYIAHTSQQSAEQGRVAALNMLGQETAYTVFHGDLNTKLYDLPFAYFGSADGEAWTWEHGDYDYAVVYLQDDKILGAKLLGTPAQLAEQLYAAYTSGEDFTKTKLDEMLAPSATQ